MSHSVDETYSVYDEESRRARKEHRCDACKEAIERGHLYFRIFILFEGTVETVKRCLKCQTIHKHLRNLAPGELWPDERLDCGEEYVEHWGVQPPPLIAAIAFMTQTEGQEQLQGDRCPALS